MFLSANRTFACCLWAGCLVFLLSGVGFAVQSDAPPLDETAEEPVEEPVREPVVVDPMAFRGPVDENQYIVGPGDVLLIAFRGKSSVTHAATVGPEGDLVLEGIAPVHVAGITLRDAKQQITDSLDDIYRNVEISISLAAIRTLRISVLGDVPFPGEYTGTALDLAGEMIERAGGLGTGASARNITIRRRNGEVRRVDLMRYRNAGDMSANPPVLDGDVVFVPNAVSLVDIDGAVAWPGTYDLGPGDTLGDLIDIAGGFDRGAVRDTVFVHRFVDSRTTEAMPVDAGDPAALGLILRDGDQIYVRFKHEWHVSRRVYVEGEAVHPGPYGINEGVDRLSDVIRRAGGVSDRASLREARIIRELDPEEIDLEFERLGTVPIGSMGETERAYWTTRMRDEPGTVVADFVRALSGDVEHDVLLLDGDRIVIPRISLTVSVGGQVANPGRVTYVPGKRYSYYVKAAGGFESGARTNAVKVIRRANGRWIPAGRAGSLEPGAEVWVPERREGAAWRMVRDVAAFAASVATAYLLIDQATK